MADRSGDLELGAPLGRGGQATVRRATDLRTGEVVAAKVLDARVWEDPRLRRRLERELSALQRVRHPGVIRVIGTREVDGRGVLVMELAEGGTLAEVIQHGPLAPVRALALLTDVAAGLDAAHRAGVVHRDVTASNVLLRADGSAVLADFGLALGPEDAPTTTDALTCTPAYVAPEVASGAAPSPEADRYSFAVLAFEVLVGRRPFTAPTAAGLLHAHVSESPPAASRLAAGLPGALDAALRAGLVKDPARRPPTAGALVASLAGALETPAARARRRSRRRRPVRRTIVAISGAAAIAATVVALGVGVGLSDDGAPSHPPPASVPGPDGGPRSAMAVDSAAVEGLASGLPAVGATVGGVEVIAIESASDSLSGRIRGAQRDRGADIETLEREGRDVAEIARDGAAAQAMLEVGDPPEARTIVLRGGPEAVETYALALAAAESGEVRAPAGLGT